MRDSDDWAYSEERYGGGWGTPSTYTPPPPKTAEELAAECLAAISEAVAGEAVVVTAAHRLRQRRYWEGRKGGWQDLALTKGEEWVGDWQGYPCTTGADGKVRVRVYTPAVFGTEPRITVFVISSDGKWDVAEDHSATAKMPS